MHVQILFTKSIQIRILYNIFSEKSTPILCWLPKRLKNKNGSRRSTDKSYVRSLAGMHSSIGVVGDLIENHELEFFAMQTCYRGAVWRKSVFDEKINYLPVAYVTRRCDVARVRF